MKENRALARCFAGLLVAATIAVGGLAPAQARDTGWNGTVPPANDSPTTLKVHGPSFRDTGWNGT